ncbi:hypothetical protein S7711_00217 [Stachybotrys chartarum IBT 7711]|uniref:Ketoreductase domain-containing protein n=1 Tax=Stachybotrys chartarum (strain CBS 109288 / IBT 7711) TaxID=1280523 RepID=A0A084B3T9_STACB|nr:hypothetical protein S7711_00217 [Stachybotrys chartarum IBT 7711]
MARVWFITGTSRGLGRALVQAVLESGDIVIATARSPASLEPVVTKYGSSRIHTAALDVTDYDAIVRVVQESQQVFGRIDVVVNNAGYAETSPLETVTVDSFKQQVDTNFFGTVWVTKAVIPIMRDQGSGRILQVSSVGSRIGTPGLAAYQSAKWAVAGLTTALASEVAPFGIKLTSLEPGGIKTDWAGSSMGLGDVTEPYQATIGEFLKLRDMIVQHSTPPEKIAAAIVAISNVDDPPLRLLLGPETPGYAKAAAQRQAESDAKWETLTTTLAL